MSNKLKKQKRRKNPTPWSARKVVRSSSQREPQSGEHETQQHESQKDRCVMGSISVNPTETVMINEMKAVPATVLYELLLEGFDRGYNRRAAKREDYDSFMELAYEFFLSYQSEQQSRAMRTQHPTWRTLKIPVRLHLYHFHKDGRECERHIRIEVAGHIFDVPESVRTLSVHI